MKVYQIAGQEQFAMNSGSVGNINEDSITHSAKMSDDRINNMRVSLDGKYIYRLQAASLEKDIFIKTTQKYNDMQPSWGVGSSTAQLCMAARYEQCTSWGTGPYDRGIDTRGMVSPSLAPDDCARIIVGNYNLDCWQGDPGHRCVRSGPDCATHHSHSNVTLWVYIGPTHGALLLGSRCTSRVTTVSSAVRNLGGLTPPRDAHSPPKNSKKK